MKKDTKFHGEKIKPRQDTKKLPHALSEKIIKTLISKHGSRETLRIRKGVIQASSLWNPAVDGDSKIFEEFCDKNFIPDGPVREELFTRMSRNLEIVYGNSNRIRIDLKAPVDVEIGKILPVDRLFAAWNMASHFIEDMYSSKIAFITVLNFPNYTLEEKKSSGTNWTRLEWAYARLGDVFTSRVPSSVKQGIETAFTQADTYISSYNIFMNNVIDEKFESLFPVGMKLITHWNLRDELKSRYADKTNGFKAQKQIFAVMKRIIDQTIPVDVINKNNAKWDPVNNKLFHDKKEVKFTTEPDTRYEYLLKNFIAVKTEDQYSPGYPTYIKRVFDRDLEYTETEIEGLFVKLVSSPLAKEVGKLIEKRLGRKLEPFDIWYDGFKTRSSIPDKELTAETRKKYLSAAAFHADMPRILTHLGFTPEKATFIQSRITVDPSRGAGHAWGSEMRTDKSHLRTRIGPEGMDYKGYNIAIHELGHNVEQTITLHDVDYYLMKGVPNTAFTEAWAFIFQRRDLELLGKKETDPLRQHLAVLDNFWSSYEIMGVSLVDMKVWRWLYANPNADKTKLKNAVISIAKEVWNLYFAPVFGVKDQTILAIYSHMIDYPLYLPAYPIGHLAEFQIEQHIHGKNIGTEMTRICSQGRLVPDLWMKGAVNNALSVDPTLKATTEALKNVK
ncbi:hypothetical protein KKF34_17850 [Myxococcota bacterium]|nr:hypothetical protein [Myxococcota bacterium]MBU1382162.1 hypothetical protein [Myxococcota bacterium]MBU1498748.1 hypothetical protein [Myxococcota bacterium]